MIGFTKTGSGQTNTRKTQKTCAAQSFLDQDGDGQINYAEFVEWVGDGSTALQEEVRTSSVSWTTSVQFRC